MKGTLTIINTTLGYTNVFPDTEWSDFSLMTRAIASKMEEPFRNKKAELFRVTKPISKYTVVWSKEDGSFWSKSL